MKKPTQKRVNELLKNIDNNFSELIDCIIYYDKKDMDDWASDIIGYIENKTDEEEINLLIKDLPNRKIDDFNIYGYQRLWWALINIKSDIIINSIANHIKFSENGIFFKKILHDWISILADGISTKDNILLILDKSSPGNKSEKSKLFNS